VRRFLGCNHWVSYGTVGRSFNEKFGVTSLGYIRRHAHTYLIALRNSMSYVQPEPNAQDESTDEETNVTSNDMTKNVIMDNVIIETFADGKPDNAEVDDESDTTATTSTDDKSDGTATDDASDATSTEDESDSDEPDVNTADDAPDVIPADDNHDVITVHDDSGVITTDEESDGTATDEESDGDEPDANTVDDKPDVITVKDESDVITTDDEPDATATDDESDNEITVVIQGNTDLQSVSDDDTSIDTAKEDLQASAKDVDSRTQRSELDINNILSDMTFIRQIMKHEVSSDVEQIPTCATTSCVSDAVETELLPSKQYVADEISAFGSVSCAACSYGSVVQRHLDTAESRSRMLVAYNSVELGDDFDTYTGNDREDLKFLLGMHKLVEEELLSTVKTTDTTAEEDLDAERFLPSEKNVAAILQKTTALSTKGVSAILSGGAKALSAGLNVAAVIARPQ